MGEKPPKQWEVGDDVPEQDVSVVPGGIWCPAVLAQDFEERDLLRRRCEEHVGWCAAGHGSPGSEQVAGYFDAAGSDGEGETTVEEGWGAAVCRDNGLYGRERVTPTGVFEFGYMGRLRME
jgi:hypothetical protein